MDQIENITFEDSPSHLEWLHTMYPHYIKHNYLSALFGKKDTAPDKEQNECTKFFESLTTVLDFEC